MESSWSDVLIDSIRIHVEEITNFAQFSIKNRSLAKDLLVIIQISDKSINSLQLIYDQIKTHN